MFQNLKTDAELPFHCELWGMWSFQPSWLGMGWRRAAVFPNQDKCVLVMLQVLKNCIKLILI